MRTETDATFATFEMMHAGTRVVVMPELGGKIASLVMGGRQWLWTSDVLPFRLPVEGASYVETADSGGFDECFPTVGPCTLASGVALQDHGELWSQRCEIVRPTDGTRGVTCTWRTRQVPARFSRALSILDDGGLQLSYRLENTGGERMPYLWSAHPLLPLTQDTALTIKRGTRMRVYAAHGLDVDGREHRWPEVRLQGDEALDLSQPGAHQRRFAIKVFLDMEQGDASITQSGKTLRCVFDPASVPNFGLWINHRGWTPFTSTAPYLNLAFEPCIGAPDTLTDALADWNGAHWIDPGEIKAWSIEWRP